MDAETVWRRADAINAIPSKAERAVLITDLIDDYLVAVSRDRCDDPKMAALYLASLRRLDLA